MVRERNAKEAIPLAELDHSYRNLLEGVATLGASIDAFAVQRLALMIAAVSLVVAFVTLVVSSPTFLKLLQTVLP